jgi:uncharacterized membrane protein
VATGDEIIGVRLQFPAGDREVTPGLLDALAAGGHLDAIAWRRARALAGFTPSAGQWRAFLAQALAIGGALLLATAVVFFVAFNWEAMGRFAKLALLEGAVAATAIAALLTGSRPHLSQPAYLAATILTGALLAFIGQTYQTGADTWQLFAAWALLSLPWAFAAAWAPLWVLVLLIADLAVALHFGGTARLGWLFTPTGTVLALVLLNVAAAALAEWAWARGALRDPFRLVTRTAALVALAAATVGMLYFIFAGDGPGHPREPALPVAWLGAMAGAYAAWRVVRRDLLLLSATALSGIVVAAASLAWILDDQAFNFGLLIAAVIVGLSAWTATWIRRLAHAEARVEAEAAREHP